MVSFNRFIIELQQGSYLASSKNESVELAEKFNFVRFAVVMYFYYLSVLLLVEGTVVKLAGPFYLNYLKASLFTLIIPYSLYRLFLYSLVLKSFDFILSEIEKSKRVKFYYYVLIGSFFSFAIAFIIVFFLYSKLK